MTFFMNSSNNLQHWADTKESEALMPELMRRLIHSFYCVSQTPGTVLFV